MASSAASSAHAVDAGKSLSELTPEELRQRSELLDDSYYEVLRREGWLESKRIEGGTSEATGGTDRARPDELAAVEDRLAAERD